MVTIGIDLHKKRSRYTVLSQDGTVLCKRTLPSSPQSYREVFAPWADGQGRVAMEATINWYWAVDTLREMGMDVHLANPHKVRLIAESTIKTDDVDSEALAQLLRMNWLPESRITPAKVRLLRERLRFRITLVRTQTAFKCRVHALLDKVGIKPPEVTDLFGVTGRQWLEQVELPGEYRLNLDGCLRMLDHLAGQIKDVEKWLAQKTRVDRDVKLLMGMPGVGRFGASLILAEIGDIGFFKDKRKLASFVGVVPGTRNSDIKRRDTGLKKDSNKYVRWLLAEAVTKACKVVPAWARLYQRVEAGNVRRRPKARMAVMHKMVLAVWRVLTTKEPFDRLHNCPELHEQNMASSLLGTGLKQGRVTD